MTARRPRAILDTQLLIRAFHTGRGATGGLIQALQADRFHLVTSEPLLEELRRTFYRPEVQRIAPLRPLGPAEIEDNIASVRSIVSFDRPELLGALSHAHAVAALVLGLVQGAVGAPEQGQGGVVSLGDRGADRDGHA